MAAKIAVAISTIFENQSRIAEFFLRNSQALAAFDQVILVVQGCPAGFNPQPPPNQLPNFLFDSTEERGLSRSRNRALELCSSEYLWILDDDVLLHPVARSKIQAAIDRFPAAKAITFEFADIADHQTLAKSYPACRALRSMELLRVSSIEIVVSVNFVRSKQINFDTRYGLGAWFPSGEETVFLLDLHEAGAQTFHSPDVIVFHPLAGRNVSKFWRMPRRLYGMGTIAKRFGLSGLALVLRWAFRGLRHGLPPRIVSDLFRGYFVAEMPER
jgi:glycosyltransferase involved in cell wall biosynthesis